MANESFPVAAQTFQERMKKLLQQQGSFPAGTQLPPKAPGVRRASPQPLKGKQAPTRRTGGQVSPARGLLLTGRLGKRRGTL